MVADYPNPGCFGAIAQTSRATRRTAFPSNEGMKLKHLLLTIPLAFTTAFITTHASVQSRTTEDWCRNNGSRDNRAQHWEIREFSVPAAGVPLTVDASPNGGIRVQGEARGDIMGRACVSVTAETEEQARAIAQRIEIIATADRVSATGPAQNQLGNREHWSVSYRLTVPTKTSMSLVSRNGGITISDVDGDISFRTTNGGVKLARLAGTVRGRTTNGGVDVDLDGATWNGQGLDVETQNGGVRMAIPASYSAQLETGTVNGGVKIEFPVTVEGRRPRQVQAQLGSGGPLIKVRTTNGGVNIRKK